VPIKTISEFYIPEIIKKNANKEGISARRFPLLYILKLHYFDGIKVVVGLP